MTIYNLWGWETGTTAEALSLTGTTAIVSSGQRTGDYCLRCAPTLTAQGWARLAGISATDSTQNATAVQVTSAWAGFAFKAVTLPATLEERIFDFIDPTGVANAYLNVTSGGILKYYSGSSILRGTGTKVLTTGVWYYIEVFCTPGSNMPFEVWVDGVADMNTTGTQSGTAISGIGVGKVANLNGQTVDYYYDDIYFGSARLGSATDSIEVRRMDVDGAGTVAGWTNGTSTLFSAVDEIPPESDGTDATYIRASVANINTYHTFSLESSANAGIDAAATVLAVMANAWCKTGSTSSVSSVGIRMRNGSTNADSAMSEWTTAYTSRRLLREVDPNGGAAWTIAGLDTLEIGVSAALAQSQTFSAISGHVLYRRSLGATVTQDVTTQAAVSIEALLSKATQAAISLGASVDLSIATQAALAREMSLDRLTQAALARELALDRLTQATVSRSLLLDRLTQATVARTMLIDRITQAAVSLSVELSKLSQATISRLLELDRATQASITVTTSAQLSISSQATVNRQEQQDKATQAAVAQNILRDLTSIAALSSDMQQDKPTQAAVATEYAISLTSQASLTVATIGDWLELLSPLVYPYDLCGTSDSTSTQTLVLDAALESWGVVLTAPKAGTIAKIYTQFAQVITAQQMTVRLETVNSSTGQPSGTLIATGAEGFFTPAVGVVEVTIDTPPTVTKGQVFWVVITFSSTVGSITLRVASGTVPLKATSVLNGYAMSRSSAGTWSVHATFCSIGVEYGDGTMPYLGGIAIPVDGGLALSATADFVGNKIDFSFKCKVYGAIVSYETTNLLWTPNLQVYDMNDTLVYDYALPAIGTGNVVSAQGSITTFFPGDPIELEAGEFLRVGLGNNPSAGGNVSGAYYQLLNAASREQFGAESSQYTMKSGSVFIEDGDRVYAVAVMISHLWDPSA
jgi:hypothetical protein